MKSEVKLYSMLLLKLRWTYPAATKSTHKIIDREFEFYEFFSFLKFNEFYDFFSVEKKFATKFVILQIIDI